MRTRILPLAVCPHRRGRLLVGLLFCAVLAPHATSPHVASAWPGSNMFGSNAAPGTPEWWKKNKKTAVFEVGRGYKVEGVDGYFDADGRPIAAPVDIERVVKASEDTEDVGLIPGLDPRVQYGKMKEAVGLGPNEQYAREAYLEGEKLFKEKEYKAAAEKYQQAAERGPHMAMEQDAMFMLAESYFRDDRYGPARDAYDALVKEHPNTRYMDTLIDREWTIARYWEEYEGYSPDWTGTPNAYDKTRPWLDTIGQAIKTYENIRLNDPTGPRADDAIMATANIYFRIGRFDDADYHYTLLRRDYPRSELQFEAHLLGLQAKLRKYQGPDYEGAPLDEAKQLVKQLRMNFSGRLSPEERERLRTVEGQLNLELATREYRMAEYFDYTKYYGAARYYYANVIKQYPDSELASKARTRVAEIAGEPADPPKHLAFLVDLFPESTERTRVARIPELQNGKTRLAAQPAAADGAATAGNMAPATPTTVR